MTTTPEALTSSPDDHDLILRLAGLSLPGSLHRPSRTHTESDLRLFFVVIGFYRTCVIDGVLEHSPAAYVRRPLIPAESPTLGLSHLQFETLLIAARQSPNVFDFVLVTRLVLVGRRLFEACGADIADVGEERGHRVLRVFGKDAKVGLVPLPPAVGRALDHAIADRISGACRSAPERTGMPMSAPSSSCMRLRVPLARRPLTPFTVEVFPPRLWLAAGYLSSQFRAESQR
jgi:integrase